MLVFLDHVMSNRPVNHQIKTMQIDDWLLVVLRTAVGGPSAIIQTARSLSGFSKSLRVLDLDSN